jgi:hypothetical protein
MWGMPPDRHAAYLSDGFDVTAYQHYRFLIYTANEMCVVAGYFVFQVDDRMLDCFDQMS